MDIKGKVHEVGKTEQVTDSLKKRELIVEYVENPQYPEYIKFECVQDKCSLLDDLKPGDDVEVLFNLRGRPWTSKTGQKSYFNSLMLWRVNKLSGGGSQSNKPVDTANAADDDNLPF